MKMRYFFFALFFTGSFAAGAQNVKFKGGTVWVDNKEYLFITDETASKFTLVSMETDSELVYVTLVDPTPGGGGDFDDRYFNVRFPDFDREAIIRDTRKATVIKYLRNNNIIDEGRINKLNFQSFIEKYGIPEE